MELMQPPSRTGTFFIQQLNSMTWTVVECLAKAGMSVNTVDACSVYHTPLTRAIRNYNLDIMEVLIANDANVNMKGYRESAPIHMACSMGWATGLRFLLDRGADPTSTYDFNCEPVCALGKLPLLDKEGDEVWQCMDMLLEATHKKGMDQQGWLHCLQSSLIPAIKINNYKLVRHLLSTEALQADRTRFLEESTRVQILNHLLVDTARFCSLEVAQFLLKAGANVNAGHTPTADSYVSIFGYTAVSQAMYNSCGATGLKVLQLLIEHGACLTSHAEIQQPAQWSAILTEAVRLQFEKTAIVLLLGNCKPLVPSESVHSALYPAQRPASAMLNFLEIYILAGGEKKSIGKLLSNHRWKHPNHPLRLAEKQTDHLRAVLRTSQNLTHLCRSTIRDVLRRHQRPVAASVTQLVLPPLVKSFLLLHEEEGDLSWKE